MQTAAERAMGLMKRATPIELDRFNSCIVEGKKYRYRLIAGEQTRVLRKRDDKYLGTACVRFDVSSYEDYPPAADRIIAEYILIKSDEQRYLKTANLSFGVRQFRADRFMIIPILVAGWMVVIGFWQLLKFIIR